MDSQTITAIVEQFPWASWAIWDEGFPDGDCVEQTPEQLVEFIHEHTTHLTPDIVLLGLNRSDDLTAPFQNFHAHAGTHYDYRLKEFIQDDDLDRLWGAYMTDLVDEVNPDSNEVEITEKDAETLFQQLHALGQHDYHVICFGNKPFDALIQYFDATVTAQSPEIKCATISVDGLTLQLYRVWFYGLYGVYQDKVDVLHRQLQQLNEQLT